LIDCHGYMAYILSRVKIAGKPCWW